MSRRVGRLAGNRGAGDGEGPFDRLVIRGITVIDGTGAPPRGPMDVVVQNNRITDVNSVGFPGVPIGDRNARSRSPSGSGRGGASLIARGPTRRPSGRSTSSPVRP